MYDRFLYEELTYKNKGQLTGSAVISWRVQSGRLAVSARVTLEHAV